jgi:methionyl-tRNA formyltransferase
MTASIAFFGNRYSPLSRLFFLALRECVREQHLGLVVVDTSTERESRWLRRARNRIVAAGKGVLRAGHPTAAIDWLSSLQGDDQTIITPSRHSLADPLLPGRLCELNVAAALVAGCDQVLRQPLIEAIPRIVNYHNSLLPRHRGCDAVLWAMLSGESVIGFSFHTIESERVDAGRVLVQGQVEIHRGANPTDVDLELAALAAGRLGDVLRIMLGDSWDEQGEAVTGGTYHRRREIGPYSVFDARLSVDELVERWRIFGSLRLPAASRLKITGLYIHRESQGVLEPGPEIGAWRVSGRRVLVRCADGVANIETIDFLPASVFVAFLSAQLVPATRPYRTADLIRDGLVH